MRYHALACDYDGTLASQGRLAEATVGALRRLRESGRRLLMVTGRRVEDLLTVCPEVGLFDVVVAENGAVIYVPASRAERALGEPPPAALVAALRQRGADPLAVGRVIVATTHPHETAALEIIRNLGLEMQVIFNKGAVMLLPSGINKATGLATALDEIGLSPHNVVGVGDAENDHALLASCECAVAVANALPTLKQRADLVTGGANGAGVAELIEELLASDLAGLAPRLTRHDILLGTDVRGETVWLPAYGTAVLLAGTSGSGKSTFAAGIVERIAERGYQHCIIDPEGDHAEYEGAVVLGDADHAPGLTEIIELLDNPRQNAAVNLLAVPLDDRPRFFESLFSRLQEMRAKTGRPHWIVIDEVHHLLPAGWDPGALRRREDLMGLIFITVQPNEVSPAVLSAADALLAIGGSPDQTVRSFAEVLGQAVPDLPTAELATGEAQLATGQAIVWWRGRGQDPFLLRGIPPRQERRRHQRKYLEGELDPDRSFYFRGAEGKLNLRAQNLNLFLQLADGVDDQTWLYHLERGDYSRWLRDTVKDGSLASEVAAIERSAPASSREARRRLREAIERRYTGPTPHP